MSEYYNDNRRYVLVVNREGILPTIRHVVELEAGVPYFQDEFTAWYYDKYRKLDGDEFVYCKSSKEMHEKKTQIEKEWDAEWSAAVKKAKLEQLKAARAEKGNEK